MCTTKTTPIEPESSCTESASDLSKREHEVWTEDIQRPRLLANLKSSGPSAGPSAGSSQKRDSDSHEGYSLSLGQAGAVNNLGRTLEGRTMSSVNRLARNAGQAGKMSLVPPSATVFQDLAGLRSCAGCHEHDPGLHFRMATFFFKLPVACQRVTTVLWYSVSTPSTPSTPDKDHQGHGRPRGLAAGEQGPQHHMLQIYASHWSIIAILTTPGRDYHAVRSTGT